ncbi:unnamed protein product [Effrenium voratum]|nr:unnamed protein product [Effrenium voratum]
MGNSAGLELRLKRADLGSDSWQLQPELVGDGFAFRARWEELCVAAPSSLVRIWRGDQVLAEARLPEGAGPSFAKMRLPLKPGPGVLEVDVREASAGAAPGVRKTEEGSFHFQMPTARRQAIQLELQNAELQKLLKTGQARPLRCQQILERAYAENAELLQRKQAMCRRLARTQRLVVPEAQSLRRQLELAQARQQELRRDAEERIAALQAQIQDEQQGMTEAEASALLAVALGRREELQRKLKESNTVQAVPRSASAASPSTEALPGDAFALQQVAKQQQQLEMEHLRQEFAQLSQSSNFKSWERHEELTKEVASLCEKLEELRRGYQDDQVCGESEVQELRRARDALKDRLDDGQATLRQLSQRAAALRAVAPKEESSWQSQQRKRAEEELAELKRMEEVRLQQIKDLELDQERLVEQTTLATVSPEPGKLEELEKQIVALQASVSRRRLATENAAEEAANLRAQIGRLQQRHLQLATGNKSPTIGVVVWWAF